MANGYVRYGNSIHLDGFQILDFCIENAISLESLRDLNLGRKVFLTGNDTNAGYLREHVWDGDRWRAAAYLDDLTSFKDEDFNKLKEKVDTLIGDGVDMDGIIESWKEVEAFLAGMSDTKTLMTMLDGKLDKTGGTIKGDNDIPLTISQPNDGNTWIKFANAYRTLGYIGFSLSAGLAMMPNDGSKTYSLIHEGNVGDYKAGDSFRLGGYAANRHLVTQYADSSTVDLNQPLQEANQPAIVRLGGVGSHPNIPNEALQYGFLLHIGDVTKDTAWELVAGYANNSPLMFRSGTWKADGSGTIHNSGRWKTIAFTDSTVEAAYKLKNPFTNGDVVTITDAGNVLVSCSGYSHTLEDGLHQGISVGSATGVQGQMWINGSGYFNIQSANVSNKAAYALNLNPLGGAVNVGEGGLNVATYMTIGNSSTSAIVMKRGGYNYIWAPTIGAAISLGVGTENPASTAASLSIYSDKLIPEKGSDAVSLGTSSFRWSNVYSVNGNFSGYLRIANDYGLLSTTTSGSVVQMIGIGKNNALFVGTDACIVNKMPIGVYGSLINFYTGDTIETRTKTMTLTSSGHVLIGGAVDDGESALQVKGLAKFISNEWHTESTIVNHAGLLLYGRGHGDYVQGMRFYGYDKTPLGHIAYYGGYFYIGENQDTTWFYIKSTRSVFNVATTFNGGALIPTGQKLTIGDATIEYDSNAKAIKVDGDMYTTGTLASGGKAKEGTGTGSGSANVRDFELPADGKTTYDCDHLLKSKNVIVQVFEKTIQNYIEVWEMIVADVTIVTEDRVTVTFGRPTTKVHKVHIIGGNVS